MDKIKLFVKNHQQNFALVIGYLLVAGLAFGLGQHSVQPRAEQTHNSPSNYSPNIISTQIESTTNNTSQEQSSCEGKIKGSSNLIYHVPGGSFYNRTTNPIKCFNTEAEAKAAGFRKSAR